MKLVLPAIINCSAKEAFRKYSVKVMLKICPVIHKKISPYSVILTKRQMSTFILTEQCEKNK